MLNIAQIGIGYWGPNLLRNLVANQRCTVNSVADLSAERQDFVKGLYPAIDVYGEADQIFENPSVDAVVIATPVATHFDFAVRALEAGKHVFVEKPLARSVAEVKEIGRIAQQKDLLVMTGHTFLFNAAVRYIKKLIDDGTLGDIYYIYSQRLNLGRIRSDVDALWNLAPHDISIIQYWLGDPKPKSIYRHGVAYIQEGIDDVVFLSIKYPGKVMANIHVSWLDPHRARTMTIVGSKKMVIYDDTAENKVAILDKGIDLAENEKRTPATDLATAFNYRSGDVMLPKIDFQEPLKVELNHFIDCIQNGSKCITDIEHAIKVVEILASENSQ